MRWIVKRIAVSAAAPNTSFAQSDPKVDLGRISAFEIQPNVGAWAALDAFRLDCGKLCQTFDSSLAAQTAQITNSVPKRLRNVLGPAVDELFGGALDPDDPF